MILVCHNDIYNEMAKLSKKYRMNIKLISTSEFGISIYRNLGIKNSKCDYIAFVDDDDYVSDRYIEVLLNEMKDDVSMTMCNYMSKFEDETIVQTYEMSNKVYTAEELINHMYGKVDQYNGFVWNKLFRRKIIIDNNIRFDENISLNEDRLFIVTYLLSLRKNSKIKYNAETLYSYIQHKGSITGKLKRGELEEQRAVSEIESFSQSEAMLENNEGIIDKLVYESVERSIRLLRLLKHNTKESRKIEKYLRRMRHKYRHLFSRKRRLQMFIYEHYNLRTMLINLRGRTY